MLPGIPPQKKERENEAQHVTPVPQEVPTPRVKANSVESEPLGSTAPPYHHRSGCKCYCPRPGLAGTACLHMPTPLARAPSMQACSPSGLSSCRQSERCHQANPHGKVHHAQDRALQGPLGPTPCSKLGCFWEVGPRIFACSTPAIPHPNSAPLGGPSVLVASQVREHVPHITVPVLPYTTHMKEIKQAGALSSRSPHCLQQFWSRAQDGQSRKDG